jgi:hypothetical protein
MRILLRKEVKNMIKKLIVGFASASLLVTAFAPLALAADLEISGNGNKSENTIVQNDTTTTTIGQSNESLILTVAVSSASTGGNSASGNTGGDVTVKSGNATSTTDVTVTGSSNTAALPTCGCDTVASTALISGNGNKSENKIINKTTTKTKVEQGNESFVGTLAVSKAKTGKNKAKNNTGSGATSVTSGNSTSGTTVNVSGSTNTLL